MLTLPLQYESRSGMEVTKAERLYRVAVRSNITRALTSLDLNTVNDIQQTSAALAQCTVRLAGWGYSRALSTRVQLWRKHCLCIGVPSEEEKCILGEDTRQLVHICRYSRTLQKAGKTTVLPTEPPAAQYYRYLCMKSFFFLKTRHHPSSEDNFVFNSNCV